MLCCELNDLSPRASRPRHSHLHHGLQTGFFATRKVQFLQSDAGGESPGRLPGLCGRAGGRGRLLAERQREAALQPNAAQSGCHQLLGGGKGPRKSPPLHCTSPAVRGRGTFSCSGHRRPCQSRCRFLSTHASPSTLPCRVMVEGG